MSVDLDGSKYYGGFASINGLISDGWSLGRIQLRRCQPRIPKRFQRFSANVLLSGASLLHVEQTHTLVKVSNQSATPITGVTFLRSFDPDNVRVGGGTP
jgi:hypothetical protein